MYTANSQNIESTLIHVGAKLQEIELECLALLKNAENSATPGKLDGVFEPFLKRTYNLSQKNPETVDTPCAGEFRNNFLIWEGLENTLRRVKALTTIIEETRLKAGSNALLQAFSIYNDIKEKAVQQGELEHIVCELDDFLPVRPKNA